MTVETMSAVVYLRVYSDEQADSGLGIAAQLASCEKWARQNGFAIDPATVFKDEGVSGDAPPHKRAGLMAALEALELGSIFLVAKRNRMSRGDVFRPA